MTGFMQRTATGWQIDFAGYAAARKAVADVWEASLRRRFPGVAWRVR